MVWCRVGFFGFDAGVLFSGLVVVTSGVGLRIAWFGVLVVWICLFISLWVWLWLFICCEVAAFVVVRSVLVGWVCSGAWCGFQFWVTAMCCFALCFVERFGECGFCGHSLLLVFGLVCGLWFWVVWFGLRLFDGYGSSLVNGGWCC